MANPLACAVALASTQLINEGHWQSQVGAIEKQLKTQLAGIRDLPHVVDVRVLGAVGVVELDANIDVAKAQRLFVERGVWIRPFGALLYIMPPFVITADELSQLTVALYQVCQQQITHQAAALPGA